MYSKMISCYYIQNLDFCQQFKQFYVNPTYLKGNIHLFISLLHSCEAFWVLCNKANVRARERTRNARRHTAIKTTVVADPTITWGLSIRSIWSVSTNLPVTRAPVAGSWESVDTPFLGVSTPQTR